MKAEQLRAIHAKGDVRSKGTLPMRNLSRSGYDIERIMDTDNIIVRKRGESTGTVTTRDDLGRVIKNIEQRQKMEKLLEQKLTVAKKSKFLTNTQLKQIETAQKNIIYGDVV